MNQRDQLIEEAAKAIDTYERDMDRIRGDESQRIWGHRGAFVPDFHPTNVGRAMAALSVVEGAYSPTDDERGFTATNGIRISSSWTGMTIRDPHADVSEARILALQSRKAEALRQFFDRTIQGEPAPEKRMLMTHPHDGHGPNDTCRGVRRASRPTRSCSRKGLRTA